MYNYDWNMHRNIKYVWTSTQHIHLTCAWNFTLIESVFMKLTPKTCAHLSCSHPGSAHMHYACIAPAAATAAVAPGEIVAGGWRGCFGKLSKWNEQVIISTNPPLQRTVYTVDHWVATDSSAPFDAISRLCVHACTRNSTWYLDQIYFT